MNAEATKMNTSQGDVELRAALITQCRLTPTALERITELTLSQNLQFVEAAMQLGFVTQADVDTANELLSSVNPEAKAGLIEDAIRKISQQRQLIVSPGMTVKPGGKLVIAYDPFGARAETIRSLRTELLLRNSTGRSNIVSVVSPSAGEGRSQLAAELAIAFAQLGRKTLLVDADMRKPQQHKLFPATNERGLGNSLMQGDRPYVYRVEGLDHMSLLTAGTLPNNPLELLSSGRFERLISDWRSSNEFIVIDTPPVTAYADALAIATLTRRVLIVTRAERTSYQDMRETIRRLATTRAQILGAAISYF